MRRDSRTALLCDCSIICLLTCLTCLACVVLASAAWALFELSSSSIILLDIPSFETSKQQA